MKTALIAFNSNNGDGVSSFYQSFSESLDLAGFGTHAIYLLSKEDDLAFIRALRELKDTMDNLIILGDKTSFDIKKIIADEFETSLIENENARQFLDAVSKADGVDYDESNAILPMSSTLIPNLAGAFQGYMIDDNEFTLAVLPENIKQCEVMCFKYVVPYLENKYDLKTERVTFKLMTELSKIDECIEKAKSTFGEVFKSSVTTRAGDIKLCLIIDKNKAQVQDVVRFFVSFLQEDIYAEFDTTPAERLFDIIKLKNLKLSTAESFTAGNIASSFIKNSGASKHFNEGIVAYSNESKVERLGVKKDDLLKEGAVSSVVAYQMALGLLKKGGVDVAISTTGIAGPTSDDTAKPVGLCYVAIGTLGGIHTYKLNLKGTREEITKTAVNKAQFLAIKILKRI